MKFRWLRYSLRTLVIAVLLAGSASGLWWRWEPWHEYWHIESSVTSATFSPDARFVAVLSSGFNVEQPLAPLRYDAELILLEVSTQAVYRRFNEELDGLFEWVAPGIYFAPDSSEVGFGSETTNGWGVGLHIWNVETGQKPRPFPTPPQAELQMQKRGEPERYHVTEDWTYAEKSLDGKYMLMSNKHQVKLWSARRPEYWWGVAWLPEFWLTLLFAGAFGWSVRRDKRLLPARAANAGEVR